LSTDGGRPAGFDERRRPQIDVADVPEDANARDQHGADKANDHDLQMGSGIRAVQ
jgi:hypothetical protein